MADLRVVGLLSILVLLLAALIYDDGNVEFHREFHRAPLSENTEVDTDKYTRSTEHIVYDTVSSSKLEAWLYKPKNVENPPVVVMAHGLALTKDMGLEKFARVFCENGLAVLTFDHRNFGGSDGVLRHNLKISEQVADWEKVLIFVRNNLTGVNNHKIGVWGYFTESGNVLSAASTSLPVLKKSDVNISAVVLNQPIVDAFQLVYDYHTKHINQNYFTGILLGLKDLLLSYKYVTIAGSASEKAMTVIHGEDWQDYLKIMGKNTHGGWENKMTARSMFQLILSRPALYAASVEAPTQIVLAKGDQYASPRAVRALASTMKNVDLVEYDMSSFAMFVNAAKTKEIAEKQAQFFKKNL